MTKCRELLQDETKLIILCFRQNSIISSTLERAIQVLSWFAYKQQIHYIIVMVFLLVLFFFQSIEQTLLKSL